MGSRRYKQWRHCVFVHSVCVENHDKYSEPIAGPERTYLTVMPNRRRARSPRPCPVSFFLTQIQKLRIHRGYPSPLRAARRHRRDTERRFFFGFRFVSPLLSRLIFTIPCGFVVFTRPKRSQKILHISANTVGKRGKYDFFWQCRTAETT